MEVLAIVLFGSIILACSILKISEWIWPEVELTPWEVEEEEEGNGKSSGQ